MRVHLPEVTPSISVQKMVSADGGVTWEDEVEQYVCQNIKFKITVINDGGVPLTNIVITDFLPDCLEYVDGPAVEVCHTTSIPYYNLPGADTLNWRCTSGLQPGSSIEVIYTAHVVESGMCKNSLSVEGEYNGEIVTGGDSAIVVGTIPCQCESWDDVEVTSWETTSQSSTWTGVCGDTLTISPCEYAHGMSVTTDLNCDGCSSTTPSYNWELIDPVGGTIFASGTGNTASFSPLLVDSYQVVFHATCDSVVCSSCILNVQHEAPTCGEEWFTVGICDNFNLPTEATNPSQALLDWIAAHYAYGDTRDCDEDVIDRYWAHTFTELAPSPCCHILSATLEITVKNKGFSLNNDHLKIGFITDSNDSWEVNQRLTYFDIDLGSEGTITLDLSDVYDDGTINLLDIIESEGFLDVAVDDDSPVDCAILHVTYVP